MMAARMQLGSCARTTQFALIAHGESGALHVLKRSRSRDPSAAGRTGDES